MRCDIFCAVIDNYGDIGVCWRLARQLAAEHGLAVRLWADDLGSLQPLCPEVDPTRERQAQRGVDILRWSADFPAPEAADIVIEAFGCELPAPYLEAMARRPRKPVWINLEYLSAEDWVEGCHGMASPHPRLPLVKHFFFPGFTPATGGLLRERSLPAPLDAQRREAAALRQALGLPAPAADEMLVSLFSYEHAPIPALLAAWERASHPVRCLLPRGKPLAQAAPWFGRQGVRDGEALARGNLTLHVLPFLRQEDYDRLLQLADFNFVRGEDSFVRAQWAGKALTWQIYRQLEDAHLVKLDAFLDRYCAGLPQAAAAAVRAFHHAWNGNGAPDWEALWQHRAALSAHAAAWAERLAGQPDLASNLVIFCRNKL